jgi:hypothetical protein
MSCPRCDDKGTKDYAAFAMDPCDNPDCGFVRFGAIDFAEHKTAFRDRVREALKLSRAELLEQCNFGGGLPDTFKVVDAAGEHDPCFLVIPGGSMLPLNHFANELTDVCRTIFIAEACNAALAAAARQGGDVKQAPAESPQSGPNEVRVTPKDNSRTSRGEV